jgi:hypothetical protein
VFRTRLAAIGVLLAAITCHSAQATIIEYDVQAVTGETWRYDYYVTNDTLDAPIDEFTIWFDWNLFGEILFPLAPAGWDPIAIQPDTNLPHDGFYDALALGAGILPGATLGGFSVQFTWLGIGTPGSQAFDIVNPVDFSVLDTGMTRERVTAPPVGVPEPGTLGLLGAALLTMFGATKRRGRHRMLQQE